MALARPRERFGVRVEDPREGDARMRGEGPYAEMLRKRFDVAVRKLGFEGRAASLDVTQFRAPVSRKKPEEQLPLFAD